MIKDGRGREQAGRQWNPKAVYPHSSPLTHPFFISHTASDPFYPCPSRSKVPEARHPGAGKGKEKEKEAKESGDASAERAVVVAAGVEERAKVA